MTRDVPATVLAVVVRVCNVIESSRGTGAWPQCHGRTGPASAALSPLCARAASHVSVPSPQLAVRSRASGSSNQERGVYAMSRNRDADARCRRMHRP